MSLSVGLFLIVTALYLIEELSNSENAVLNFIWEILLCLTFIRIVSRGIEIIVAFYKDIVKVDGKLFYEKYMDGMELKDKLKKSIYYNGFKNTLLRPQGRLSLAIHSLIEVFILFAAIYTLLPFELVETTKNKLVMFPIEMLFYSFSVSLFNVSFGFNSIVHNILHVSQLLLSGVLILLSIAQYLNGNNKLTENSFEYEFYRAVQIDKHEKKQNSLLKYNEFKVNDTSIYYNKRIIMEVSDTYYEFRDSITNNRMLMKVNKRGVIISTKYKFSKHNVFIIEISSKNKVFIDVNDKH